MGKVETGTFEVMKTTSKVLDNGHCKFKHLNSIKTTFIPKRLSSNCKNTYYFRLLETLNTFFQIFQIFCEKQV